MLKLCDQNLYNYEMSMFRYNYDLNLVGNINAAGWNVVLDHVRECLGAIFDFVIRTPLIVIKGPQ